MDDGHLAGELRQIHGLFHGSIAAADHVHFKILEEGGVAGRAEGNALADELALVLAADGARERAGGDDDALGLILALYADELLHGAGELDLFDHVAHALNAEMLALLRHTRDQARAAVALDLTGIIFNFIGDGDLTAILTLFDHQGRESGAPGIEAGRQACGARAQNDNVVNLAHFVLCPPLEVS